VTRREVTPGMSMGYLIPPFQQERVCVGNTHINLFEFNYKKERKIDLPFLMPIRLEFGPNILKKSKGMIKMQRKTK
jgi:hypothetical protein